MSHRGQRMNSFLVSSRVSISVSGVRKSNLQSMAFACTISAVTLTYAVGLGYYAIDARDRPCLR